MKLVLKRETVTELTAEELRAVAGAAWTPWCYSLIEPTGCLSHVLSCDGACPDPL
jgi:hypothetical protein